MIATKDRSPPTQSGTANSDRLNRTAPIGEIIQIIINKNLKSKVMKTAQLNGSGVNGKSEIKTTQPVNNGTANKVETKAEEVKDIAQSIDLKNVEQVKPEAEAPKVEPTKIEIKEQLKDEKPALNLEKTIKLALDLNRRINQRGKLLETINTLEAFEVAQKDDADETDTNFFQGCTLTLEDDKGREFTTKNPFIIREVASRVNALCVAKLAEIEGEIFIPA
ncbi:hypothetical protein [Pedobacter cryotolerans]|uniref:Uncharacterized protein n=1 Tax=Pedobacter cryotolerans TaxID=2571270 RepID=A0A4U1C583_9SPHI|nr:hypothetical protein [Pedobacter cryotolerans]TKB98460.1 hypothetical protein FA045_14175 [Pedobacter cryotolerans]